MWARWGGSLFGTNRENPPDVAHIYQHTYLSGPNRGCLYQCNIDLTPHRENSWSLFGLHIGSFSSTVQRDHIKIICHICENRVGY